MPSFRRWMDSEYERLRSQDKHLLVEGFDVFSRRFFDGEYRSAINDIPRLHDLADRLGEPYWRVTIDYFGASAAMQWEGDLTEGLRLATRAVVQAERLPRRGGMPGVYAREMLLSAWLDVDGPGYAPDVLKVIESLDGRGLPPDTAARFGLLRGRVLALQGRGAEGRDLVLAALPALDWPESYRLAKQASTLLWVDRVEEALAVYQEAVAAFGQDGMSIEAAGLQMGMVDALIASGRTEEALKLAGRILPTVEGGLNRAQVGMVKGQLAQGTAMQGDPVEAAEWYEEALADLNGLGWLRLEAELAVGRCEVITANGASPDVVEMARADAAWCIRRLAPRSADELVSDLERIVP